MIDLTNLHTAVRLLTVGQFLLVMLVVGRSKATLPTRLTAVFSVEAYFQPGSAALILL